MKAQEKETVFNLLKKAADSLYGYSAPEFSTMPIFTDDPEPLAHAQEQNQPQPQDEKATQDAMTGKPASNEGAETKTEAPVPASDAPATHEPLSLLSLGAKIRACRNCPLCNGRTNAVPGQGAEKPAVLVIGEGPGEEEDKQGLPFVGPAGQLLDKMLASIQLDRHVNCYIANTVKCRPPYNRDPSPTEAAACRAFLDAQIHLLKPRMILAVGKVALRNLLAIEGEFSLNKYRGKLFDLNGIPLCVTYHPSALLRNADFKRPAWEDLKFFKSKLLEVMPDYADGFVQKN